LREIGEPARKAMIVDLAQESVRARSVFITSCSCRLDFGGK
jgi:hypothetical protein